MGICYECRAEVNGKQFVRSCMLVCAERRVLNFGTNEFDNTDPASPFVVLGVFGKTGLFVDREIGAVSGRV